MKAMSLRQPWATLVATGAKRMETRSWSTDYRGPIAIHAARRWTTEQLTIAMSEPFASSLGLSFCRWAKGLGLPRGAIVAVAELVACYRTEDVIVHSEEERPFGDYSSGRWAWLLDDVREIPPVFCAGRRGIFELPGDVSVEVERRLMAAV